ncbi:type II toxin-antitoxin system MqsR family toxin [Azospirillum lipoferum]|nr:type II toxin-antitoxin system MqsR family toxin [Azospirillum lipoferum]
MSTKRKPTYALASFQAVVAHEIKSQGDNGVITGSAIKGARSIGLGIAQMGNVIASLTARHFNHSVTTIGNSKEWQDVYYFPYEDNLTIYIKFRADAVCEFRLLSFKEKDEGS